MGLRRKINREMLKANKAILGLWNTDILEQFHGDVRRIFNQEWVSKNRIRKNKRYGVPLPGGATRKDVGDTLTVKIRREGHPKHEDE